MTGPRRLKYDDAFRQETGCDLTAEERLVGNYDLPGLKESVLARTAAQAGGAALGGTWWVAGGGVAAVSAFLVLGAWMTVGGSPAVEAPDPAHEIQLMATPAPRAVAEPVAEPVAPASPPMATAAAVEVVETRPVAPPAPVPAVAETSAPEPTPAPAAPSDAPSDDDGVAAVDAPAPVVPAPVAPRSSALALEAAHMDDARERFNSGDVQGALDGYLAYLKTYTAGSFREEANINILECMVQLGNHEGVAAFAGRLAGVPELAEQREGLLRTQAEALIALNRCDDALVVAEQLPRKLARELRGRCE